MERNGAASDAGVNDRRSARVSRIYDATHVEVAVVLLTAGQS